MRRKLSPGEHSMAFTMRNNPRKGMPTAASGVDDVLDAGMGAGSVAPVVRDRTTDRVVSTTPVWTEAACRP